MTCKWCSNPEGQSYSPELAYNVNKCIGMNECDRCMRVCKPGAVREGSDGKVEIDRELCDNCGSCVDVCPSKALELFGRHMSVDDVIKVVEEDSGFYARSGGGLTLSGGEPLSQAKFVGRLLEAARSRGIDTALETSGYCDWEDLRYACSLANQVFFDIKSMDPKKHKDAVGVENGLILDNFRRLCESLPDIPIIVRTPIIPGFNDSPNDIRLIADLIGAMPGSPKHELLSYHGFGEPKYRQLGKQYPLQGLKPPPEERMAVLRRVLRSSESPV